MKHFLALSLSAIALTACGTGGSSASPGRSTSATPPRLASSAPASASPVSAAPSPTDSTGPSPAAASPTAEPEGGTTAAGDIPDNAVFLTYRSTTPTFSIQYVEGWQVTPQADGVVIRDKDSSETVSVVVATDPTTYIDATDLPALKQQPGFKLVKRDTVKVGQQSYDHLVVNLPAPPDPVTGKQVPSTVDRFYVPGPNGLAVVSLSTPNGVDNVDAFKQMIDSFTWS